jgi:regulator of sigma E protease
MSGTLISILALLVTLGVLIAFHEFGHFWVARRCGVKVLKFSIGFGTPIWSRRGRRDDTEYVIAAVPLGGYVQMLDGREGQVAPQEQHRAFNNQSIAKRVAIVSAGPLANFLFAIMAFTTLYLVGVNTVRPLLDAPRPNTPAAEAGFQAGDLITAVDGSNTPTLESAILILIDRGMSGDIITVEVETELGETRLRQLDLREVGDLTRGGRPFDALGLVPWRPEVPPIIDKVIPGGAAEAAGLRAGDLVVSVDGEPVQNWQRWAEYVRARPEQTMTIEVDRVEGRETLTLTPEALLTEEGTIGRVGAMVRTPADIDDLSRMTLRYGPLAAIGQGMVKTWDMTLFTTKMMGRMVIGQASLENISGPITIAQYAGQTASISLAAFLSFMALVSISLGVINLLPIPILDGGHLLYYFIEWVRGKPLSEAAQFFGQRIGLVMIVMLMGLALFNDFVRLTV